VTLRIVPQIVGDGTHDAPLMPGEAELARSSFRCIQGGAEQDPKPRRPIMKPNKATRLYQLRNRLFEEMAAGNTQPLIDELMRIVEGDVDPDPEAA
jgi:hypothetical protein